MPQLLARKTNPEKQTRAAWGARLEAIHANLRLPMNVSMAQRSTVFKGDGFCRWATFIALCEALQVDWEDFKPLPIDVRALKTYQLVQCDTDEDARLFTNRLIHEGFTCKRMPKAGIFHAIGETVTRLEIDIENIPDGYQILPVYLFI